MTIEQIIIALEVPKGSSFGTIKLSGIPFPTPTPFAGILEAAHK
jgi:hypothetical protein